MNNRLTQEQREKYILTKARTKRICDILFNVKIEGIENIPSEGPVIIASSHESALETVVIPAYFKRDDMHAVAKQEIWDDKDKNFIKKFQWWFTSTGGAYPIDREKPQLSQYKNIKKALTQYEECLLIFPEGTRCKGIQEFKPLIANLVEGTEIAVIPLAVYGSSNFLKLVNPFDSTKIHMSYGKAVYFPKYGDKNENIEVFTKKLENTVREDYQRLEKLYIK